MELDHVYICTDKKAPAGDLLVKFGLTEGSANTHPGQGTANRRFFFHNMMLELLWVENMEEVTSSKTKPMKLYEKCMLRGKGISPFGLGFRRTKEMDDNAPFPSWDYQPIYLPDTLRIQVAKDTPISEPMYFYLFFAIRQDQYAEEKKEPIEHKVPLRETTSVKVYINQQNSLSESAELIEQQSNVTFELSNQNLLELEFDHGLQKQTHDFRPELPLIFKW
jgi:hypothetical protein